MAARRLLDRIRALRNRPRLSEGDSIRLRLDRRTKVTTKALQHLPTLRTLLLIAGYLYILALPYKRLGRGTYISENAIQPAQVNTYWGWGEVYDADRYDEEVRRWIDGNLTSLERSERIKLVFEKNGLPASSQSYSFDVGAGKTLNGTNAYSILPSVKTDGAESVVLSASWLSRDRDELGRRKVNVRGVATVFALSKFLKKFSLWSKDIILVISDGYEEGMQAWLNGFHSVEQNNLISDRVDLVTGPAWAALNLDYPYHSFSHLGIFFEGANGQRPNLDLINTAVQIARWSGGVPVRLHADPEDLRPDEWSSWIWPINQLMDWYAVKEYERASKGLWRQIGEGVSGTPSGPEGVFGKFRIDAITLFGVPADGPHGFYALGKTVESTLRSINNILERFHQSFFLYLLTTSETFISVGNYLAAPVLIGVALALTGLLLWAGPPKKKSEKGAADMNGAHSGPQDASSAGEGKLLEASVLATFIMLGSYAVTGANFWWMRKLDSPSWSVIAALVAFLPLSALGITLAAERPYHSGPTPRSKSDKVTLATVLSSFTLILAGLLICVTAALSFSLSVGLAVVLGPVVALHLRPPQPDVRRSLIVAVHRILFVNAISPTCLVLASRWLWTEEGSRAVLDQLWRDWHVLGTWFLPFLVGLVLPIYVQLLVAEFLALDSM